MSSAFAAVGAVPVGTIVAYVGPICLLEGSGWELCNGDPVADIHSEIFGQTKPPLVDLRFLIGTNVPDSVNEPLGTNDVPSHNHGGLTKKDGTHIHKATTDLFGTSIGDYSPGQGFETAGGELHNHKHSFVTSADETSAHNHSIPDEPKKTGANIPASSGVYWILKVR
jgi:hypothetical protein